MLTTFLLFLATRQVSEADVSTRWVDTALASDQARQVVATFKAHPLEPLPPGKSISRVDGPSSLPLNPGLVSAVQLINSRAMQMIRESRFEEAYDYLVDAIKAHPHARSLVAHRLIQSALLTGHYADAYREIVLKIKIDGATGESLYLSLAMACAGQGMIYPGQVAYCQSITERCAKEIGATTSVPLVKNQGSDSNTAFQLSRLALGLFSSTILSEPYLDQILQVDPQNELAARGAIRYYDEIGKYSEVRRIASEAVGSNEQSRSFFMEQVKRTANLKDRSDPSVQRP